MGHMPPAPHRWRVSNVDSWPHPQMTGFMQSERYTGRFERILSSDRFKHECL